MKDCLRPKPCHHMVLAAPLVCIQGKYRAYILLNRQIEAIFHTILLWMACVSGKTHEIIKLKNETIEKRNTVNTELSKLRIRWVLHMTLECERLSETFLCYFRKFCTGNIFLKQW